MTVTQRIIGLDTQYNPLRPLPSNQYSEKNTFNNN